MENKSRNKIISTIITVIALALGALTGINIDADQLSETTIGVVDKVYEYKDSKGETVYGGQVSE